MGLFSRNNSNAAVAVPPMPKSGAGTPTDAIVPPPAAIPAVPAAPQQSMAQRLADKASGPAAIAAAPPNERQVYLQQLKVRIHQQLVERLDMQNLKTMPPDVVRNEVRILIRDLCQSEKGLINSSDQ